MYVFVAGDAVTVETDPADDTLADGEAGRRGDPEGRGMTPGALDLPVDRTPHPPPTWPDVLPKFAMPFTLNVRRADVHGLRISREGAPVIAIARLPGRAP